MKCAVGIATLATISFAPAAPAQTFEALEGKSIIAQYSEVISMNNERNFSQTWTDIVYVSSKGRIFHRHDRKSGSAANEGSHEAIGDREGAGESRKAKFAWTGSVLSRQWKNSRGVHFRQIINVNGSGCSVSLSRQNAGHFFSARETSQSCRVVPGNALATS